MTGPLGFFPRFVLEEMNLLVQAPKLSCWLQESNLIKSGRSKRCRLPSPVHTRAIHLTRNARASGPLVQKMRAGSLAELMLMAERLGISYTQVLVN